MSSSSDVMPAERQAERSCHRRAITKVSTRKKKKKKKKKNTDNSASFWVAAASKPGRPNHTRPLRSVSAPAAEHTKSVGVSVAAKP